METRRVGRPKTTAVFLAFALLLAGGAAAVSAARDLFPVGGLMGGPAQPRSDESGDEGDSFTLGIPIGGLAPGASTRGSQVVRNTTDGPLRYSLSSSTADHDGKGLRDVVLVTIKTSADSPAARSARGLLRHVRRCDALLPAGSARHRPGFGDPRIGRTSGDRVLAAGEREMLCFEIRSASIWATSFRAPAPRPIWTIAIEQVAGNP